MPINKTDILSNEKKYHEDEILSLRRVFLKIYISSFGIFAVSIGLLFSEDIYNTLPREIILILASQIMFATNLTLIYYLSLQCLHYGYVRFIDYTINNIINSNILLWHNNIHKKYVYDDKYGVINITKSLLFILYSLIFLSLLVMTSYFTYIINNIIGIFIMILSLLEIIICIFLFNRAFKLINESYKKAVSIYH